MRQRMRTRSGRGPRGWRARVLATAALPLVLVNAGTPATAGSAQTSATARTAQTSATARAAATGSPAAAIPAPAQPPVSAHSARQQIVVRVTRTELARPVPSGFLGLSMEFGSLYAYAGSNPRAPDPVFARLLANLVPGQRPVLRIGGDSTDRTWWPVSGMSTPPWVTYTLTPAWRAMARAVVETTHARLILGINLLANSTAIASTEARALLAGIGRPQIAAFEIGNEPELYSTQPWYWTAHGRPIPGRPPGYSFNTYAREVTRIRGVLPRLALAGPATGTLSWLSHLPAFLAGEPRLSQVTFHRYPLNRCLTNPSSSMYATVPHLLSAGASEGLLRGVARYAALAHRHGKSFRVDELNAVTCGGEPGVSNTFASALWTLDTQFWMLRSGVDAVDVHIHPEAPANQLFTFRRQGDRWIGSVRPQYYGLLMFAQAAPPGARLLALRGPAAGQLHSWATVAPDGRIRVVLINESLTAARTVLVRPPAPAPRATLERLEAPSAYATSTVTLGGQSFGSQTPTGTLAGRPRTRSLSLVDGAYRVAMPAASAATLTIP